MAAKITVLTPMVSVANVQRSINFYELLGLKARNTLKNEAGQLIWAHLECESAELMLSWAGDSVNPSPPPPVRFYLYSPNLVALREQLLAGNIKVSSVTYPNYMPKGEAQVEDPDGYILYIGQSD